MNHENVVYFLIYKINYLNLFMLSYITHTSILGRGVHFSWGYEKCTYSIVHRILSLKNVFGKIPNEMHLLPHKPRYFGSYFAPSMLYNVGVSTGFRGPQNFDNG